MDQLVTAAAATTDGIKLGTAVAVLSTDDPIRAFEQLAIADAIAPGRIDAVAGRGSSTITFDLFDHDEADYDLLFASKLDLLLTVNTTENIDFAGPHRRKPLRDNTVYPRPARPLPIWLGTGGSPNSVIRAAELGVPMFIGILGGTPQHWARYGHAYRHAWTQTGRPAEQSRIAVAVHGFVGPDNTEAKSHLPAPRTRHVRHRRRRSPTPTHNPDRPRRRPPTRRHGLRRQPRRNRYRIIDPHQVLGHDRQILQMDIGGPHTVHAGTVSPRVFPAVSFSRFGRRASGRRR
ncbi:MULTISPECIES: LLM class flavin-dependent oxidoreductase [Nocardia]|uniref:LLM class flavin-dependent oxidoreductase n=1 Tax=Nocardia TaxID=1817 RepID=UPI000D69F3B2|nr:MULTISPECIES: LLM class flavin-dependent oxidoreductase [Nocardia]